MGLPGGSSYIEIKPLPSSLDHQITSKQYFPDTEHARIRNAETILERSAKESCFRPLYCILYMYIVYAVCIYIIYIQGVSEKIGNKKMRPKIKKRPMVIFLKSSKYSKKSFKLNFFYFLFLI